MNNLTMPSSFVDTKGEFKLAGSSFQKNAQSILACLSKVDKHMITIDLIREPKNTYDRNAIQVILGVKGSSKKYCVGYVGKENNEYLAFVIDNGGYDIQIKDIKFTGGEKVGVENHGLRVEYKIERKMGDDNDGS